MVLNANNEWDFIYRNSGLFNYWESKNILYISLITSQIFFEAHTIFRGYVRKSIIIDLKGYKTNL